MECSHFHWKHKGAILPEMWFAAGNLLTKSTKCVQTRDSFGGKTKNATREPEHLLESHSQSSERHHQQTPQRLQAEGRAVSKSSLPRWTRVLHPQDIRASSPPLNFWVFMEKLGCGSTAPGLPAEQPRRVRLMPVKTFQNYRHKARPDQNKLKRSRQGLVTS